MRNLDRHAPQHQDRPRKLILFPFTEWHLAPLFVAWDNYCNYVQSHWVEDEQLIVATLAEPSNAGAVLSRLRGGIRARGGV